MAIYCGFRGGSKSGIEGQKWHTGWSDELKTTFNRFTTINNIGIDTKHGMVVIILNFDIFGSAVAQKVAKVAKSGTPDGPMALKPLLIDSSSSKT